jgi:hypothetical protein
MNQEHNGASQTAEQWAAFQQIWGETFSKLMQLGFTCSPESAPPDFMRQMRSGIFQALGQSWEQFLRSPQFMEGMKQHMDNAIAFRKMSGEFFSKMRHETQSTSRDDIDAVMLAVRHMETRVLDRVERLAAKIDRANQQPDGTKPAVTVEPKPKPKRRQAVRAAPPQAGKPQPVAKRKPGAAKKTTPRKR